MILGALIDAGLELRSLQEALKGLNLPGCEIGARRVKRGGLSGMKVDLLNRKNLPRFPTFLRMEQHIKKSGLSKGVQKKALEILGRLAKAEGEAHGRRAGRTDLHEVGAVDTLIDVVGAVAGLSLLKIDRVLASPIQVGSGEAHTEAGVFPVPAPATASLLKSCPIYGGLPGELTTPTGAAILSTLSSSFSPLPLMTVEKIGWGAGSADRPTPNLLRLFIGTRNASYAEDEIVQVETNIDDMNPQLYEHVIDRLFSAGALDVFLTPIIMKRGRPAILLTALVEAPFLDKITEILFAETTTLGLRVRPVARKKLERKIKREKTPRGTLRVKTAFHNGKEIRARPEFRDVRRLARQKGEPLRTLWEEIMGGYEGGGKDSSSR